MKENMVENIRRIGIFMIAAQTVIHFAAGNQYEKYMKVITGVIVLLQFISPFVASFDDIMTKWQAEAEQITEQMESQAEGWQRESLYADHSVGRVALQQIEEEIKLRLNNAISDRDERVMDVKIVLEEGSSNLVGQEESDLSFRSVRVTLWTQNGDMDHAQEDADRSIQIGEIIVGKNVKADTEQKMDQDTRIREYRRIFSQVLGIGEEQVEVDYCGGW